MKIQGGDKAKKDVGERWFGESKGGDIGGVYFRNFDIYGRRIFYLAFTKRRGQTSSSVWDLWYHSAPALGEQSQMFG